MLRGEDLRRRHDGHLIAVFYCNHGCLERNQSFAAADVALQQPKHGPRRPHVFYDLAQYPLLCRSRTKGKDSLERFADELVGAEGNAGFFLGALFPEREACFEQKEFLEDEPNLSRTAK